MAAPSNPLLDFLMRLQEDPEVKAQYAADPRGAMTAAGVSAEDQETVLSRDPERLNAALPPSETRWSYSSNSTTPVPEDPDE